MKYQIKLEQPFVKRMDHLGKLFHLSDLDMLDARESILDAIELLASGKDLPEYYDDYLLHKEPWRGYHEFHVFNDLLVVYYNVDSKRRVRMVTITNHKELTGGRLP